jgi:hypothetical protein
MNRLVVIVALQILITGCEKQTAPPPKVQARPCLLVEMKTREADFLLTNKDARQLTDIEIVLNETENSSGFKLTVGKVDAGQTVALPLSHFVRDDGLRFDPASYTVVRKGVKANEGSYERLCDPAEKDRVMKLIDKITHTAQ